jgi:hypothetical protein
MILSFLSFVASLWPVRYDFSARLAGGEGLSAVPLERIR